MSEFGAQLGVLAEISTCGVSDALDRIGHCGSMPWHQVIGSSFSLGPAYTMRCLPVGIDGGSIGDYIDDVEPGSVAVIDNAGGLRIREAVTSGMRLDEARKQYGYFKLQSRTTGMIESSIQTFTRGKQR